MKKVLSVWSMVVLMAMSVGFSSCSVEDDDEGSSKGSRAELYLDGNKLTVYDWYNWYTTDTKYLGVCIGTEKSPSIVGLNMYWDGLDINSLSVGDDMCKKAKNYTFDYPIDMTLTCYAKKPVSVIVKDINLSKNQITFEFKDTEFTGGRGFSSNDKTVIISGIITAKYEVETGE